MTSFHEFLNQLLNEGRVVFRSTKAPHDRPRPQDIALLEKAYLAHRLSVAGPDIPFDPAVAFSAAELIRQASWALVNHDDRISHLKKCLTMPIEPVTPAHHLSADLTLRYLPQIFNRARVLDPCDPFIDLLTELLRRWPLSGVLSDVAAGAAEPRLISAGTPDCCCFMPSGSPPTTARPGGPFKGGLAGNITSS